MTGKTHIIIGIAAGLWLLADPLAAGMAGVGALAPDIDTPHSAASRAGWPFGAVIRFFVRHHRGITHSALACALVCAGAYALARPPALGFALGYMSHLLADMTTKRGLAVLWPSSRVYRLLPARLAIRTGGRLESLIAAAVGCLVVYQLLPLARTLITR